MKPRPILGSSDFEITLMRLCRELREHHGDFGNSVIIGLQPRGIFLARRIQAMLRKIIGSEVRTGALDITFFRDDFRQSDDLHKASRTEIDFLVEGKDVILADDVLFTGRTVRAAMEALLQFGRPHKIELLVMIDRRFSRQLPVAANYVGRSVDTIASQKVKVQWKETDGEDAVWMINQ